MSDELDTWQQKVEELKREGYHVIAPNNLPIRCIMADGTMKEHEHSDHRDYKFPVMCEYIGGKKEDYKWCCGDGTESQMDDTDIWESEHEEHAFIYTEGSIVVTVYETCKAMWNLSDGECVGGHLWEKWDKMNKKGWRINEESLKKIKEYFQNVK
jgi:hypothetical protein